MLVWHRAVAGVTLQTEPREGNSDARSCLLHRFPSQVLSHLQERHQRGGQGRREAESQQEESEDAVCNHGESERLGEGDPQNIHRSKCFTRSTGRVGILPFSRVIAAVVLISECFLFFEVNFRCD